MPNITYIQPSGESVTISLGSGLSIMEGAIRNGIMGIEGECGGACACGTCRVEIPLEFLAKVGVPSAIEQDLLSGFTDNRPNTRLSCQIAASMELEGLHVITAPGDKKL
jgi:2Fe-2S ferredoxin